MAEKDKADREARLAAALRENLKRRKAAAREREASPEQASTQTDERRDRDRG